MLLDKTRTVKIADFGVARVEASNPNDMTGETGTLGYMAPEVCVSMTSHPHRSTCILTPVVMRILSNKICGSEDGSCIRMQHILFR